MHIKGSFICSEGIKVKLDGDEEEIGLLKSLVKVIFFRESKLGQKCDICSILLIFRPISASFLIRTSGKEYHSQAGWTTPLPPSSPWHSRENVRKWRQHGSKKALVSRSNLFLYSCCLQKPPELFCKRFVMIQKLKVSVLKYFLLLWPG